MKPIWNGAIRFGLVYIPVQLYKGSDQRELEFRMLRRGDLCPIHYARVCRETGEEVPYEEVVRGFEYEPGQFVVLEEEDFQRANVLKTQTIDLVDFVDSADVDLRYVEKPYYIEPLEGGEQGYTLLRNALLTTRKLGVGRFVLRTREHMALIAPQGAGLVLVRMRFTSEVRPMEELALPEEQKVSGRELDLAVQLVQELSAPWQPEQYQDTYTQDLKRVIQDRIEGREPEPAEAVILPGEVTDLLRKLTESLQMARNERSGKA